MELGREILNEILSQADLESEVKETYSGRGMYGKTCPSITVESMTDVFRFMVAAGVLAEWYDGKDQSSFDADALATGACTDSIGLGMVIYWPNLKLIN